MPLKDNISMKNIRTVLFFSSILFSLTCIRGGKEGGERVSEALEFSVNEPIERDLSEIKKSGVLKMITSYSSGAYFLHRGIQVGFEYELVKEFARLNDLAVEVVIPTENENPYDLLNSGQGDLIAANYTITEERKELVSFTRPYNLVNQIIVVSDQVGVQPESISELSGIPITIRRNSSYYLQLKELQNQEFDIDINLVSEDMDTETLLFQVATGEYEATVSDDNIFTATHHYTGGLIRGPMISEGDEIAWAVRKNSKDLEARLNRFLYQHFKYDENGVPKRSAFLNILKKRYYESSSQIEDYFRPDYHTHQYGGISPYDSLMQQVASEFELDWVMLTAIAAQESKFDPYSESWAGALGIMQVLPRFSEISRDSLYIPEHNIREGARIIKEHLEHYSYMDSTNHWQFALATYNAGMGHVADARRLSIDQNKNPNEWSSVSESLLKLMQRRYYQHVRYGFCRGIETVRYVNEITNRYNTYQAILVFSNTRFTRNQAIFEVKALN